MPNCPVHKDEPIVPGRSRCERCLTTIREYQRNRRAALKKEGKCVGTVGRPRCANQARPGRTMCQECADTFNRYQAERAKAKEGGGEGTDAG